jgi:uncharacterized protein (DUF58 family)
VLRNGRGRGAAWQVELIEQGSVRARAFVEHCPAGGRAAVPADFCFPQRGLARLGSVRVQSDFPFGMVRRWRDVPLPDEVLVYPAVAGRVAPPAPTGEGDEAGERGRPAPSGEFAGLRPWAPGDALRHVHWPTTARVGEPMVVTRVAHGADERVLVLDGSLAGERREAAITRLAGQLEAHLALGAAVGLDADGALLPARSGSAWRRRLLTALALLERR